MNIKMTSIPVNDPVKAHEFYTEVLGFDSYMFTPEARLAIVHKAEIKNGVTLLLEPNEHDFVKDFQSKIYDMKLPYIILGSDNVAQEYQELLKKGVKFIKEPTTDSWGTSAIFDDGFGNYIQIHEDLKNG